MKLLEMAMVLAMVPFLSAATCAESEPDPCDTNPDADDDGFDSIACGGTDCNDSDGRVSPSRTEVCDAADLDEDCNAATFGVRDSDSDGYVDAACCNVSAGGRQCGDDCDDTRAASHPSSNESCNSIDDDCDLNVDEGVLQSIYNDGDHDGYGAGAVGQSCVLTPGTSYLNNDCDDGNSAIVPGEMKCLNATDYQICVNGTWSTKMLCPAQTTCRPQPNGTGVCI